MQAGDFDPVLIDRRAVRAEEQHIHMARQWRRCRSPQGSSDQHSAVLADGLCVYNGDRGCRPDLYWNGLFGGKAGACCRTAPAKTARAKTATATNLVFMVPPWIAVSTN
jgi:hypothetical protein